MDTYLMCVMYKYGNEAVNHEGTAKKETDCPLQ